MRAEISEIAKSWFLKKINFSSNYNRGKKRKIPITRVRNEKEVGYTTDSIDIKKVTGVRYEQLYQFNN